MSIAHDILRAAGLDPANFAERAHAWAVRDKPALLAGIYEGYNVVVRGWPRVVDADTNHVRRWDALALISAHPGLALNELTHEERERLQAESQTPVGADAPVGQEAVLDQSEPVYAPPLQPLVDTAESVQADAEPLPDDEEIEVEEAPCGNPGCFKLTGPEGVQITHVEGCVEFEGAPDA